MNKFFTLTAGMAIAFSLQAQKEQYNANGSFYKQCINHWESRPLSELVAEYKVKHANDAPKKITPRLAGDAMAHERIGNKPFKADPGISTVDGARQTENGTI